MEFVELTGPGPLLTEAYDRILTPSFPANELCSIEDVARLAAAGHKLVWAAVDDGGELVGIAVGDWDEGPRVVLLSWLAARPGMRGGGIGGPLLDHVTEVWRTTFEPCLILAEVEDPRYFSGSEDHGDPSARWRFYTRRGGRPLDIPYFQAALGPGKERVANLLLMVLHGDPEFAGELPDTVRGATIHEYIELYQTACEGAVGTDPDAKALYDAIDRPGGIPYIDISAF